jgi:hypothetical protein
MKLDIFTEIQKRACDANGGFPKLFQETIEQARVVDEAGFDCFEALMAYHERLNFENELYTLRLTWDVDLGALGPATVVAVSGYIDNNWYHNADIDQSSNPIQYQTWGMHTDRFTQETRVVSAGDGRKSGSVACAISTRI